jgi:hypothetical protein
VGININNEIYAAQIGAVYQQTPMVLIVNVVNAALVTLILGSYAKHPGFESMDAIKPDAVVYPSWNNPPH